MSDKNKKETQNESSASGFIKMATTTRESTAVTDQPLILSGLDVQTKMKLNEKDVNAPSGLITVVGSSSGFGVVIVHELIHRMNIQRQLGKQPMALRAVVLGETDTQRITIGTSALYQNVEIVEADVFNREQISKAIEGSNFVVNVLEPHHIFGYRGLFNKTKSVRRSNRDAAIELVEACKQMSTKPHMIYISKTGERIITCGTDWKRCRSQREEAVVASFRIQRHVFRMVQIQMGGRRAHPVQWAALHHPQMPSFHHGITLSASPQGLTDRQHRR